MLTEKGEIRGRLAGLRVLNTKSSGRADRLSAILREGGAEVFDLPLLQIRHLNHPAECGQWVNSFNEDEWIVITSPNGAEAFLATRVAPRAKIACIGGETAAILQAHSIEPKFVPARSNSAAFAEQFILEIQPPRRVGLFRGSTASRVLPERLAAGGFEVAERVAYEVTPIELGEAERATFSQFLERRGIVVIASALAAEILSEQFGKHEALRLLPVVAIGPVTAARAGELGFVNVVPAEGPSDTLIVQAIGKV